MRIPYAERNRDTLPDNRQAEYWCLHEGYGRLYICGPGPNAWFPVTGFSSAPNACHGTARERHIARQAVGLLSVRFHECGDATPEDIRATLEKCGWTPDEWTTYPKSQ